MHGTLITGLLLLLAANPAVLPAQESRGVATLAEDSSVELPAGKQHLALIAISDYQQWPPLKSPVRDVQEIRDLLVARYRIDEVYELYDRQATKANILKLFVRLQEKVKPEDSLLVVYAGHGHLDRRSNTGFWIPANAGADAYEQQGWLPHTQLKGLIANIEALHIFVISDSCFAGDLMQATRSLPPTINAGYFRKAYGRVSRQVLTSGTTEPVPDASDFAYQLKSILRHNRSRCLDALMLYQEIRLGVESTIPLLGSLPGTGHQEGGSFLLFLKEEAAEACGAVAVESNRGGTLYVDGVLRSQIGTEVLLLEDLEAGEHELRIVYEDGVSQQRRIRLEAGQTEGVSFVRAPEAEWRQAGQRRRACLSASTGLHWVFPVGGLAGTLAAGVPAVRSQVYYNFALGWGDVGVGISTGLITLGTARWERGEQYVMSSLPLGLSLRHTTPAVGPGLYSSLECAAGAMINIVRFAATDRENITAAKFFIAPLWSVGARLVGGFRIAACGGYLAVFFDNTPLTAWSAGARAEYEF